MSEQHIIYGLIDPITKIIHYVGYSSNKKIRLHDHCYNKSGTKEKRIWIAHLKKQGLQPIIDVIEEYTTAEELPAAEEFWYGYFRMIGAELYNNPYYIGERSRKGIPHTEEVKATIREKRKGQTPFKGRSHTEEAKSIMREKRKGRTPFKGKTHTKEAKQRISKAGIGRPPPNKGKPTPDKTKRKISEALKGRISERRGKTWKVIDGKITWIEKPNAPEGMQQCTRCEEIKVLKEFHFTDATHTKLKGQCKSCTNKQSRESYTRRKK